MRNRTRLLFTAGALGACLGIVSSCRPAVHPPPPPPAPLANPCTNGTPPTAAIVCVDDSNLTIEPPANPITVEGKRAGAIQWFTVSGTGSLGILFDTPGVLRDITCTTAGHCRAIVMPNAATNMPFKYTIVLQKGGVVAPPHDPIIIIKP